MKLEAYWMEPCIIVLDTKQKQKILETLERQKKLYRCKFLTMRELLLAWYGTYHIETLVAIQKKKEVSLSNALLIARNLPWIEDKNYESSTLNELVEMKKELHESGLWEQDQFLSSYLHHKKIVVLKTNLTKKEKKIFADLEQDNEIIYPNIEEENRTYSYGSYDTVEEEVVATLEQILDLLKQQTDINRIKLWLPNSDYHATVHRLFSLFQIPLDFIERKPLDTYPIVQKYLELRHTNDHALDELSVTSAIEDELFEQLVQIEKETLSLDPMDHYDAILYLCHTKYYAKPRYQNCVSEISSLEEAKEGDIVFALGMSLGCTPRIARDDDYLSDIEKEMIGIETSQEKNKREKEVLLEQILHTKHLYLSYARKSRSGEYAESPLIDLLKERNVLLEKNITYTYDKELYNQYLLACAWDQYVKYQEKTKEFQDLSSHVPNVYQTYHHEFQGIGEEKLHRYLQELTLSYSSIQTFYQCQFRYYLNHVLKLYDKKEETTSTLLGNIVHAILCRVLKENLDTYDEVIDDVMKEYYETLELEKRDRFYQKKYKEEIISLIDIIKKQLANTKFEGTYYEEKFSIAFDHKIPVILKGFIDKVMTLTIGDYEYVLIIDYKTGTIETNFNPVIYGLNMQLLIYYYLLLKTNSNTRFAGMYWQNIMKDLLPYEKGKTYQERKESAYRWNGYTTKDREILDRIDTNLENSFIQSMKVKKDGSYYHYVKALDDQELERLLAIVEGHIKEAIDHILKADFKINPKKIGIEQDITGCRFCPYRNICFMQREDVVARKEYKNLEFMKEEGDL